MNLDEMEEETTILIQEAQNLIHSHQKGTVNHILEAMIYARTEFPSLP